MKNILTVDVEEWYHSNLAAGPPDEAPCGSSNLAANIARILELCDLHGARATFFTVGAVAEREPRVVQMIHEAGHPVAVHGYDHRLLHRQSPDEFERDLVRSLAAVRSVTGRRVRGFRAPSWSMTRETAWVYEILERHGLEYDASVFPIRTFLYGIPDAPRFPHYVTEGARQLSILEIPTSTVRVLGRNLPFSGGFFLRVLPALAVKAGIRRVNSEGHPAVVYVHPWEIDPTEARLSLPPKARFIQYVGLPRTLGKLRSVMESFTFTSIEDMLDSGGLG